MPRNVPNAVPPSRISKNYKSIKKQLNEKITSLKQTSFGSWISEKFIMRDLGILIFIIGLIFFFPLGVLLFHSEIMIVLGLILIFIGGWFFKESDY